MHFLLSWSPWKIHVPVCLSAVPSSLPFPVSCDSVTPCSWWLCCLKELTQGEGTARLSTGRDKGPWVFSVTPVQRRDIMQDRDALALERRLGILEQARDMGALEKGGTRPNCAKCCRMGHKACKESHMVVSAPGSIVLGWECFCTILHGAGALSIAPVSRLLNYYVPPSFNFFLTVRLFGGMKS